jgi:hypothetical protein
LKPERWRSALGQEKYQEEKTYNKRLKEQQQQHNNNNNKVKELQKTAILGTAHILRKVLM